MKMDKIIYKIKNSGCSNIKELATKEISLQGKKIFFIDNYILEKIQRIDFQICSCYTVETNVYSIKKKMHSAKKNTSCLGYIAIDELDSILDTNLTIDNLGYKINNIYTVEKIVKTDYVKTKSW